MYECGYQLAGDGPLRNLPPTLNALVTALADAFKADEPDGPVLASRLDALRAALPESRQDRAALGRRFTAATATLQQGVEYTSPEQEAAFRRLVEAMTEVALAASRGTGAANQAWDDLTQKVKYPVRVGGLSFETTPTEASIAAGLAMSIGYGAFKAVELVELSYQRQPLTYIQDELSRQVGEGLRGMSVYALYAFGGVSVVVGMGLFGLALQLSEEAKQAAESRRSK